MQIRLPFPLPKAGQLPVPRTRRPSLNGNTQTRKWTKIRISNFESRKLQQQKGEKYKIQRTKDPTTIQRNKNLSENYTKK